ncbi:MAG: hypothetical protein QXX20_02915 [Candidatus Thermoplasmatota archaeon]
MDKKKSYNTAHHPTNTGHELAPIIKKIQGVNGGVDKKVEIKIVGSIADKDEVDVLKSITEVFIIERRIRDLFE